MKYRLLKAFGCCLLLLAASDSTFAQSGPKRRAGSAYLGQYQDIHSVPQPGVGLSVRLLDDPIVQNDLRLTDDQRKKITGVISARSLSETQFAKNFSKAAPSEDPNGMVRLGVERLKADQSAKASLTRILTPLQNARFSELYRQSLGPFGLAVDFDLQRELNLTAAQVTMARQIHTQVKNDSHSQGTLAAATPRDRRWLLDFNLEKYRAGVDELNALLSDEQFQQLRRLKGKALLKLHNISRPKT